MSDNQNKGCSGGSILGALGIMLTMVPVVLFLNSKGVDSTLAAMGLWFVELACLYGIGWLIYQPFKAKKERAKAEEEGRAKKQEFYRKCVREGVTDLASPVNRQKAELIARATVESYGSLEELFSEARELCAAEDRAANEARLEKLREQERERESESAKYAQYYGRDKRIAMLTDLLRKSTSDAEVLRKYATMAVGSTQQKESDWAIMGGLASGLAGGAAGLATAADIQAKNAQVRAQNAANLSRIAPAVENVMMKSGNLSQQARSYAEEIERTRIKLVSEKTGDQVLENLRLSETSVHVSDTGAIFVSVKVGLKGKIQEFDGRPAIVDGTIDAIVSQDSREVGRVKLVMPKDGLGNGCTLSGIRCAQADAAKPCEVRYAPYKLWIMEA